MNRAADITASCPECGTPWRVRGTPESHGEYERPMRWTMTARDVVDRGIDRYVESVGEWARSILSTLRAA